MQSSRSLAAIFSAVIIVVCLASSARSQAEEEENERPRRATNIQEARGISGTSDVRATFVRQVQLSDIPQGRAVTAGQATSAATTISSADTAPSLVLQSFQGPVGSNPPDPAIAVGPNHVIATVNSTMTIYDKQGTALFSTPIAVFMFQPTASVWDTHLLYDANSGHFFVVCVTGDQRTTGTMLLAVSATSDARGSWYLYTLKESKVGWLDFPAPTVTTNSMVVSFLDIAAQGSTQTSLCSTEVIGLAELVSGNQNLKITRFDNVFGGAGFCNFAYPAINYDAGNTAYLITVNSSVGNGDSLAMARIDTSGTPALDVFTIPVPHYSFPAGRVTQKGSSTGIYPGSPDISSTAVRNGSLWATQTVATADGSGAAVRWYQIDPGSRSVKQVGEVAGVGNAWMGAVAVLPDNQVDLVYTTSSANDYASAGYAHRSAADAPNTMPITGVYQAGSSAYTGTRWGDFYEAWADPDGHSAWGIAEYLGASNYGTAIVQLASSSTASVTPQITLAVSPTNATVNAGEAAKFAVAVTAQNSGPISFSCSGLPAGGSCTFNPTSLNGSGTVDLTIATARTSAALMPAGSFAAGSFAAVLGIALLPGLRRRTRYVCLLLVVCGLAALVACGGVSSSPKQPAPTQTAPPGGAATPPSNPTPPPPPSPTSGPTPPVQPPSTSKSYAVTITAAGSGTQASATVSLTVK